MGIPVTNLLPQFAVAAGNSSGGAKPSSGGFAGLLALLGPSAAADGKTKADSTSNSTDAATSSTALGRQLAKLLSALTDGKLDLTAPGLGLNSAQQEQLLSNLE